MTNKFIRIIAKIVIILVLLQMFSMPKSNAASDWDNIFQSGENFIKEGKSEAKKDGVIDFGEVKQIQDQIYNILLSLGVVLAVIIGGILGVQIMWGSIEQQVKAKEMLMPYGVGCLVIFGAFGIWKLAVTIFSQI